MEKNEAPDETVISFEEVIPNPEYLIKSIAEQGYSLETSLADLIDNSISANANHIEVLINTDLEPFKLFIADDGDGMDKETLKISMRFPSSFLENVRDKNDLGRFGLGLKTASFAQTRKFTVLSRKRGTAEFSGRTWDVDYLKATGKWQIIINDNDEIDELLKLYNYLSHNFNSRPEGFEANTIVIWHSLYKFEEYVNEDEDRKTTIKHQISEVTTDYLALVFHRFLERKTNPLFIKVNHRVIEPFNPFPVEQADFRSIENKQRSLGDDVVRLEGFVLPSRSIDESKEYGSVWSTKSKGLMDLEGIYIYRADRIIVFGGWNEIIKSPILRLARLKVEVGNKVDHLFHLNVAKSQIIIPFNLQRAFLRYIVELKAEAEKEYYNRGVKQFGKKGSVEKISLFEKKATNKGMLLEVNNQFPLLSSLKENLNNEQLSKLNFILKMVNTTINTIRRVHESHEFTGVEDNDGLSVRDIIDSIKVLKDNGLTSKYIKENILPGIGYSEKSIPEEILILLK